MGRKSTECSNFQNISGHRPRGYGCDLVRITLYACSTDNVSKKVNLPLKEVTFGRFEFQCVRLNIIDSRSQCSLKVFEKTKISTRYTRQMSYVKLDMTNSIIQANWLGALHLSTLKRHCPFLVTKAVLSRSLSSISVCQYPHLKSQLE